MLIAIRSNHTLYYACNSAPCGGGKQNVTCKLFSHHPGARNHPGVSTLGYLSSIQIHTRSGYLPSFNIMVALSRTAGLTKTWLPFLASFWIYLLFLLVSILRPSACDGKVFLSLLVCVWCYSISFLLSSFFLFLHCGSPVHRTTLQFATKPVKSPNKPL